MAEVHETRIGRYEVLAELGRGAMGVVYQARDPQLERIVAIKTLRADLGLPPERQAEFKKRFYREAVAAGRLNHPGIVAIHDVVEIDETPYIVMEYVEGRTLAQVLVAEGLLPPQRAVDIVIQVCRALEYAHARGIVHRDIKPGNILVAGSREVKVSDFGIARIADSKMTQTGMTLGSPSYMSPEQVQGVEVDGRSDLFALGVVLYEILTGVDPFSAESPSTVLYKIVHVHPPALQERNRAVSPALDAVVRRALAKDPGHRFQTARAFADALLDPAGSGATRLQQDTVLVPAASGKRARLRLVGMGAGCLLLAAAGGAGLWSLWAGRQPPPPHAETAPPEAKAPEVDAPGKPQEAGSGGGSTQAPAGKPARKIASAARVPPAAPPPAKRASGVGSIRVVSNAGVEILVGGRLVGKVERSPFVLDGVTVGQHSVTLRLGSQERRLQATVIEDQPSTLTHFFAAAPPAAAEKRVSPPPRQEPPSRRRETPAERPEPPKKQEGPPSILRPPDPS
jgi:serine/threonine-protein kinase